MRGAKTPQAATEDGEVLWPRVVSDEVSCEIDCERGRTPRECDAGTATTIVMAQQLVTEPLGIDDETARTIRSQADDFTNHAITRHLLPARSVASCQTRVRDAWSSTRRLSLLRRAESHVDQSGASSAVEIA